MQSYIWDMNDEVYFHGRRTTIKDILTKYNVPVNEQECIIDKLIDKGSIQLFANLDPERQAMDEAQKSIDLDKRVAEMEANEAGYQQDCRAAKRAAQPIYAEVEIDCPTEALCDELLTFTKKKLGLESIATKVGNKYILTVYDITPDDLSAINRRRAIDKASRTIFGAAEKAGSVIVNTADFATTKVLVPATRVGIKAAIGITATVLKTAASTVGTIVTSTYHNANRLGQELKNDQDVITATRDIGRASDYIRRSFQTNPASSGVRIKQ